MTKYQSDASLIYILVDRLRAHDPEAQAALVADLLARVAPLLDGFPVLQAALKPTTKLEDEPVTEHDLAAEQQSWFAEVEELGKRDPDATQRLLQAVFDHLRSMAVSSFAEAIEPTEIRG